MLKIKAIFQQLDSINRITYKSTTILHVRNEQIKNRLKPVISSTKHLYLKYNYVKYQLFIVILENIIYRIKNEKNNENETLYDCLFYTRTSCN